MSTAVSLFAMTLEEVGRVRDYGRTVADRKKARAELKRRKHRHNSYLVGGPPDEPLDSNAYYLCGACGYTRRGYWDRP